MLLNVQEAKNINQPIIGPLESSPPPPLLAKSKSGLYEGVFVHFKMVFNILPKGDPLADKQEAR